MASKVAKKGVVASVIVAVVVLLMGTASSAKPLRAEGNGPNAVSATAPR